MVPSISLLTAQDFALLTLLHLALYYRGKVGRGKVQGQVYFTLLCLLYFTLLCLLYFTLPFTAPDAYFTPLVGLFCSSSMEPRGTKGEVRHKFLKRPLYSDFLYLLRLCGRV